MATGKIEDMTCCDLCLFNGVHKSAIGYCTECDEHLCQQCMEVHKEWRITRQHLFVEYDMMPRQRIDSEEYFCTKHADKLIEYWCKKHDVLGCSVCITLEHRSCEIEYIDDLANGYEQSVEYSEMRDTMTLVAEKVQKEKSKALENKEHSRVEFETFLSDMKKLRAEMDTHFDDLEAGLLEKAQLHTQTEIDQTELVSSQCEQIEGELKNVSSELAIMGKGFNQKETPISRTMSQQSNIKSQVSSYERQIQLLNRINKVKLFHFERNENILEMFQPQGEIGSLLKIMDNPESVCSFPSETEQENNDPSGTTIKPLMVANTKDLTSDTVMHQGKNKDNLGTLHLERNGFCFPRKFCSYEFQQLDHDTETPLITGMAVVDEGRLVMADFKNEEVKLFDMTKNIVELVARLPNFPPYDVTCLEGNTIVAACGEKMVYIHKTIKLDWCVTDVTPPNKSYCRSVSSSESGEVIVIGLRPSAGNTILVFDRKGMIIKEINLPVLRNPWPTAVDVCPDGQTMYLTDFDEHSVKRLDKYGNIQEEFNANCRYPSGIAVANNGVLYVISMTQSDVLQISNKGDLMYKLSMEEEGHTIARPSAIAFNKSNGCLYVSNGSNKITAFTTI